MATLQHFEFTLVELNSDYIHTSEHIIFLLLSP